MNFFSFLNPTKKVYRSKINGILEITRRYNAKALMTGVAAQSGGELIGMWKTAIKEVKYLRKDIENVLVLGVGGGTVLTLLKKNFPKAEITAVEIDPVMLQIAQVQFNLKTSDYSIVIEDAVKFMKSNTKKYDLIIVDLFVRELNPEKTRKYPFLLQLKKALKEKGILLYNSHFVEKNPQDYQKLLKRFEKLFSHQKQVYKFFLNRVLLLSN